MQQKKRKREDGETYKPTLADCYKTGSTELIFEHTTPIDISTIHVFGLYPPAASHVHRQLDNLTSKSLITATGSTNIMWCDISTKMPIGHCKDVDLQMLHRILTDDLSYGKAALKRQLHMMCDGGFTYIAGNTVQTVWDMLVDEGMLGNTTDLEFGIRSHTIDGKTIYSLNNRHHPSAHLMSRGDPKSVCHFRETTQILIALQAGHRDNIGKTLPELLAKSNANQQTILRMMGLQTWTKELMTQRLLPFFDDVMVDRFKQLLENFSCDTAYKLLAHAGTKMVLPNFVDLLISARTRLDMDGNTFAKFAGCGGFMSALVGKRSTEFIDLLISARTRLDMDGNTFAKFAGCNGFMSALVGIN